MAAPQRNRVNVFILATCQMLFGATRTLLIATAPLIAYGIVENKGLATLPAALVIVGTALATMPASMLMRATGRRLGFMIGACFGALGGGIVIIGIVRADFWLLCLGTLIYGFFAAFGQYYRFAAADTAPPEFRSKAISLVLTGGVIAAVVGTSLAMAGQFMIPSGEFFGSYLFLIALTLLTVLVLLFLDIPNLTPSERSAQQRPLAAIMAQPIFVAATLAATMGQGAMNLLMTATPIAMTQAGHSFTATALVIQWHSIGMFAPGFVTGSLIKRFGEVRIILVGVVLQVICVVIGLAGTGVIEFWFAMLFLGVGWNFAFTGGTSLLTTSYTPAERNKTQGAMSFINYTFVALVSLSSGALVHFLGWQWVNLSSIPLLVVATVATVWYALAQPKPAAAAA
ncbi:MAG: MFS transporter [Deltaproteobacteria bacterium]|nr:MFS transporter [Deltaproteobacteria bacterium]